ncbi:maltase 2-like isoform X2 [Lycorma delicatula]|uniref:maltase 2-like isoform X2 n=1 Tax=Lycorma delicatula TaxID=130591 RepID=UPI003F51043F
MLKLLLLNNILLLFFATISITSCFKIQNDGKELDWWQKTIIYQVYPRSFKDSNGDGIGDLKGIEEVADYFKWLGVGAVWLNPIYKSPMVDFGYDVSNFTQIHKQFGTINDLKSLAKKLESLGIKLILDFVPNHTSDQSVWFKKSVHGIEPYTEYYVWKEPKGTDENGKPIPPNNWISAFDVDPAWTYNEKRKKFYLHHFHSKMPDLNYKSPHVRKEMENVILFWLDADIHGLRVDAVPYLIEAEDFGDEELIDENGSKNDYSNLKHSKTMNQPETYELLREWRKLVDDYTAENNSETRVFITEAYTDLEHTLKYYGTPEEPIAHFPFNFELITRLDAQSDSYDFADVINKWLKEMPEGAWPNWVIGNHDRKRIATLFGPEMVDVLNTMVIILPGTGINYYGDELGMENTFVRWDQTVDPQGLVLGKKKYESGSRDGARTPMQWDNTSNAGFTTADKPWLPVNPNYWKLNLKNQQECNQPTHVKVYRKLAAAMKHPTVQKGDFQIYTPSKSMIVFTRTLDDNPTFIVVMNIGSESVQPDLSSVVSKLPDEVYVYTASINSEQNEGDQLSTNGKTFWMRPKSCLVLTTSNIEVNLSEGNNVQCSQC